MKLFGVIVLLFLACSCENFNNKAGHSSEQLQKTKSQNWDTLHVLQAFYILSNATGSKKIKTETELIKELSYHSKNDSLYVTIHYTFSDKIDTAFQVLRKLSIPYESEVTKDFFMIPYPNTRPAAEGDTTK